MSAAEAAGVDLDSTRADPGRGIRKQLQRYSVKFLQAVSVVARAENVRPMDIYALLVIRNCERLGEIATPGAVGQALALTSGTVTGLIDRLVRSGWVLREPDAADRRRVRLSCAEAGRALVEAVDTASGLRINDVAAERSAEELALIEHFLTAAADHGDGLP